MKIKGYQVIEDNGGGITLAVYDADNKVVYLKNDYEYTPNHLDEDIQALIDGDDPTDWEGNSDDPQGDYDRIVSYEYGWEIVKDERITTTPATEWRRNHPKSPGTVLLDYAAPGCKDWDDDALLASYREATGEEWEFGMPPSQMVKEGFMWLGERGWVILSL